MAQDRVPRSPRASRAGARTVSPRPSKSTAVPADARAELLLRLQAHAGNHAVSELVGKHDELAVQRLGVGLLPAGVIGVGPAAAAAAIAPPKLKLGSKGPAVKDVQEKLNGAGAALIADVQIGGQTRRTVMALEHVQGLKS